ncbi:MAG: hypothetical protein Rhob2KO_45570 [Rhodopirellula baltica]
MRRGSSQEIILENEQLTQQASHVGHIDACGNMLNWQDLGCESGSLFLNISPIWSQPASK